MLFVPYSSTLLIVALDLQIDITLPSLAGTSSMLFFRITQYIGDTRNARTLIPMNTRTQTLPL
jgi:hypothetical protein